MEKGEHFIECILIDQNCMPQTVGTRCFIINNSTLMVAMICHCESMQAWSKVMH